MQQLRAKRSLQLPVHAQRNDTPQMRDQEQAVGKDSHAIASQIQLVMCSLILGDAIWWRAESTGADAEDTGIQEIGGRERGEEKMRSDGIVHANKMKPLPEGRENEDERK